MPTGFGIADHVVVTAAVLFTTAALSYRPRLMLYAMPTLLSLYFFVPFVTLLTPWQLVPLMLGGWLLVKGRIMPPPAFVAFAVIFLVAVAISASFALIEDDAGLRPVLRALHYLSLLFMFTFTVVVARAEGGLRAALWGLAIAGAIHCSYALYQVIAFETGLPFRGIVRGPGGGADAAVVSGMLRVNGLANEPKRLAYVLFAAVPAALYLAATVNDPRTRGLLFGLAAACFVFSLMTFSASYFVALALTLVTVGLFSARFVKLAMLVSVPLIMLAAINADSTLALWSRINSMVSDRLDEVENSLGAERVYRQEFFAQDYVANHPSVIVLGVGMGRYNRELHNTYGPGAGYSQGGSVAPINSQVYEIMFDLGLVGLLIWYLGGAAMALWVGKRTPVEFTLFTLLTFLIVQSLFIANLPFAVFVLGICGALVIVRSEQRRVRRRVVTYGQSQLGQRRPHSEA